jgi:hypothetical protein
VVVVLVRELDAQVGEAVLEDGGGRVEKAESDADGVGNLEKSNRYVKYIVVNSNYLTKFNYCM